MSGKINVARCQSIDGDTNLLLLTDEQVEVCCGHQPDAWDWITRNLLTKDGEWTVPEFSTVKGLNAYLKKHDLKINEEFEVVVY